MSFAAALATATAALTALTATRRLPTASPAPEYNPAAASKDAPLVSIERDGTVVLTPELAAKAKQENKSTYQNKAAEMAPEALADLLGTTAYLADGSRRQLALYYYRHDGQLKRWPGSIIAAAKAMGRTARPGDWGAGLLASISALLAEAAANGPGIDCQMVPEACEPEVIFEAADCDEQLNWAADWDMGRNCGGTYLTLDAIKGANGVGCQVLNMEAAGFEEARDNELATVRFDCQDLDTLNNSIDDLGPKWGIGLGMQHHGGDALSDCLSNSDLRLDAAIVNDMMRLIGHTVAFEDGKLDGDKLPPTDGGDDCDRNCPPECKADADCTGCPQDGGSDGLVTAPVEAAEPKAIEVSSKAAMNALHPDAWAVWKDVKAATGCEGRYPYQLTIAPDGYTVGAAYWTRLVDLDTKKVYRMEIEATINCPDPKDAGRLIPCKGYTAVVEYSGYTHRVHNLVVFPID
jgi:hypothetical protein